MSTEPAAWPVLYFGCVLSGLPRPGAGPGRDEDESMIDLHCHLLPGVDDGSRTMEDALALASAAVANGIHTAVLTPHVYPGVFDNRRSSLLPAFAAYRQALAQADIALDVRLGGEVHLLPDVFDLLAQDELPMIGGLDGRRMMLLEFPDGAIPHGSDVACRMFADQGVRWLIAHPERNKAVMRNPDCIKPFVDMGCLLQLTAASVIGAFGRAAGQTAHTLLSRGLAHVVASDAHNLGHRPPRMNEARQYLSQHFGMGIAYRLTEENPARILAERTPEPGEPSAESTAGMQ
ncbi:MAG: hypothetical protein Q4B13_01180 [Lautropia sp.]|nr:hypothetical protein [Lautropia sp.]